MPDDKPLEMRFMPLEFKHPEAEALLPLIDYAAFQEVMAAIQQVRDREPAPGKQHGALLLYVAAHLLAETTDGALLAHGADADAARVSRVISSTFAALSATILNGLRKLHAPETKH